MRTNESSNQLLRELAVLKQRLSQTADPIERRTLLVKMSAILRQTDALAENFEVEQTPPE
jgi:hypothetical protein